MAFFEVDPFDELADDLKRLLRNGPDGGDVRGRQLHIGPSEVGLECPRRVAYLMARKYGGQNRKLYNDPLPSIRGRAMHAWGEGAAEWENAKALITSDDPRWLAEHRVTAWDDVQGGIGTCDLFDKPAGIVIDWKFLGVDSFRKNTKDGPKRQYLVQPHVYGAGFVAAGWKVNHVAIAFVPATGRLRDLHLWHEPFNPQIAEDAHQRMRDLQIVVQGLDVAGHPERFLEIPITPSDSACEFCPHRTPEPSGPYECKGNLK